MEPSTDPSRDAWREAVPELLARCAARWKLGIGEELDGFFGRVFACTDATGSHLVLKLSPPHMPAGEACETWRDDSDELQEWVRTEGRRLLTNRSGA